MIMIMMVRGSIIRELIIPLECITDQEPNVANLLPFVRQCRIISDELFKSESIPSLSHTVTGTVVDDWPFIHVSVCEPV